MAAPTGKCFLDLPPAIRREIYFYAGLVTGYNVSLGFASIFDDVEDTGLSNQDDDGISVISASPRSVFYGPFTLEADDRRIFHDVRRLVRNLVQVSRLVYQDVASMFYSESRFRVVREALYYLPGGLSNRQDRGAMRKLANLSPFVLASLEYLVVQIHSCTCPFGPCCSLPTYAAGHGDCVNNHAEPLGDDLNDQAIIEQWQAIGQRIAQFTTPDQLELHIICDVKDATIAKQVVQPLMGMSGLKAFSIRLAPHRNSELTAIAHRTWEQVTRRSAWQQPSTFRYMDLPLELQIRILEFTDLVSNRPLEWSHETWKLTLPRHEHGDRCSEDFSGCHCSRDHSAASSSCDSWVLPSSFFLVSHQFRHAALKIFFSQNKFVVRSSQIFLEPRNTPLVGITSTNGRFPFELFDFLTWLPAGMIRYLTFLEFPAGPKLKRCISFDNDHTRSYFLDAIHHIVTEGCLDKLTLVVHINWTPKEEVLGPSLEPPFPGMTPVEVRTWHIYHYTLSPLRDLRGAQNLWIHFNHKFISSDGYIQEYCDERIEVNRQLEEAAAQKLVTGKDHNSSQSVLVDGVHGSFNMSDEYHGSHCLTYNTQGWEFTPSRG